MAAEEEVVILARLAGTRQFLVNAEELGVAIEELGIKTDATGAAFTRTARRGYLMNQALFTVRRLLYGVTLATIASGVAAIKWGFDFNSAMQQAHVALQPISSSLGGVNKELDYLFNFTKFTPFQFKDVTIAFRQMFFGFHALGISAGQTNNILKAMVDNLSATGKTSPGALNRVSVALQHMANVGHLTGQNVLQLARDGIQIYPALRKELHLTADQMHNIGQLGIPVSVALQAIVRYIETTPGLMNASHRQAIHTFHGLFTTFKDNLSQLMGAVELGFFGRMQHNLVRMNAWFSQFSRIVRTGNIDDIARAIGGPNAVLILRQVTGILSSLWGIIKGVIGELAHSRAVWATLILSLGLLHGALYFIQQTLFLTKPLLAILIPLWITYKTVTILDTAATWLNTYSKIANKAAVKDLTFFQWLFIAAQKIGITTMISERLWMIRATATMLIMSARLKLVAAAQYIYTAAVSAGTIATALFTRGVAALRLALATLWVIMMLNPVTLIATAIAAAVAGLVVLYFKWKWFHNLINSLAGAIWQGVTKPFRDAYEMILRAWHTAMNFWSWMHGRGGRGGGGFGLGSLAHAGLSIGSLVLKNFAGIPGLATGGSLLTPGTVRVGEHGPELLHLPAGARIAPLGAGGMTPWGANAPRQPIILQVLLPNKKVLAEAYAEVALDSGARA